MPQKFSLYTKDQKPLIHTLKYSPKHEKFVAQTSEKPSVWPSLFIGKFEPLLDKSCHISGINGLSWPLEVQFGPKLAEITSKHILNFFGMHTVTFAILPSNPSHSSAHTCAQWIHHALGPILDPRMSLLTMTGGWLATSSGGFFEKIHFASLQIPFAF